MSDQKYNGWSNKPTWLVNVWYELENAMDDETSEDDLSDDWNFEHHTGGGWRGIRNDAETDNDVTVYCSSRNDAVQAAIEIEAGE